MDRSEIDTFIVGTTVSLQGYTSSSKSKDVALNFTLFNVEADGPIPVLFQINFYGEKGLFDMSNASAFDGEDEVLIQDGLEYKVKHNAKETTPDGQVYQLIILSYNEGGDDCGCDLIKEQLKINTSSDVRPVVAH